ncbi:MAG: AAA family ATPase [Lachnospiraceae bacterium]|nr:AAA family ATPase [Lachnospiraceae bacterium]MDE6980390.1 AAA family ATPase [Lachnospiraceae bacterium]
MNKRVLFIGGSPCSGKSTVAERISKEYGAYYFKVDDFLDRFINIAAEKGFPTCKKSVSMTSEEIWMREPLIQCEDEFLIYDEISKLVFGYLDKIDADFIVTEGAAYTPNVMAKYRNKEYISIIPTPEFQISHYRERKWVPFILEGCSDKQQAFQNWMERDILFAKQVKLECKENAVPCIVNDGFRSEDEMFRIVKERFILK